MPSLPRINPGPRGFGRRADASDFGGAEAAAQAERGQAIGQVGGALAGIVDSEQRIFRALHEAKVGRLAAELAAGDDEDAFNLESDPDLETHAERFEKSRAERLKAAQQQLPPEFHGELEARAFGSAAQTQLRVRVNVRQRARENTRAFLDESGRSEADRAARALDPVGRDQIRGAHFAALDRQQALGSISLKENADRRREFDRTVSGADVRELLAADPLRALTEMEAPESPILRGFDADEAEQWRERARDQYRQFLGEQRAARAEARANAERAEREAAEGAMRSVIDATAEGDPEKLRAQLKASRSVLSPEQYEEGLKWLSNGARFSASQQANPQAYIELSNAAARGEPVAAVADEALRQGRLSKADRDRVIRVSEGKRFHAARELLLAPTKQGLLSRFDPTKGLRDARMVKDFDDWTIENSEATRKEVEAEVSELHRRYGYEELQALPPARAEMTPDAEAAALIAQHAAGQITDEALDSGLAEIERREAAQRLVEKPK